MAVSDEEVEKARERVSTLRAQIADAEGRQSAAVAAKNNEIVAEQLKAEEKRLTARLERAREAAQGSAINKSVAPVLEQLTEQQKAAEARAKTAEKDQR